MNCYICNKELIWGGDHDYDDCDMEGNGIISNLSCPDDECDTFILVYHTFKGDYGKRDYRQ